MELPELPKKNKKVEANFGTVTFRKWFEKNKDLFSNSSFELKQTATNSLPFNAVEDNQVNHALRINHPTMGCLIRIETGNPGAPDYVFLKNDPAYIVAKYPKGFVFIGIDSWEREKKESIRKSLTWDRACEIAEIIV